MTSYTAEDRVLNWLETQNYNQLFTRMCCGHFAIASFHAGFGDLFCFESYVNPSFLGHVFVVHPQMGPFDAMGHRSLDEMLTDLTWCRGPAIRCDEQRVTKEIDGLLLSRSTEQRVFQAARTKLREMIVK